MNNLFNKKVLELNWKMLLERFQNDKKTRGETISALHMFAISFFYRWRKRNLS